MPRYIEVNALMNYANNQKDKTIDANDIARFPWADVRENVHAHWNPVHLTAFGVCSACGSKWQFTEFMSFCPNCGAGMNEVTE